MPAKQRMPLLPILDSPFPIPGVRLHRTLEHHLKHKLAAEKGQQQDDHADQGQAYGAIAAPAPAPASEQQDAEDNPRGDREDGLVGQLLDEQVLDKQHAADQGQGQEHEARGDQLKQKGFR